MRYGTFCSGIEAPTVAWEPMGWDAKFYSEIEKFPCTLLDYYYPDVPNLGDMEAINGKELPTVDVVCAGTPCQSYSIAGKRAGLDDPRGNLALVYLRIVAEMEPQPRWILWENVPGVLSSNGGRDFGTFISALEECGYGWAYRVLDAKYFGVPQRRRRVFVVGYLGDWRRAASVLFERESVSGDTQAGEAEGEEIARCLRARSNSSHRADSETYVARCLNAHQTRLDGESETFIPEIAPPCSASGPPYSRTGNARSECDAYVAFNWQSGGDVRHNVSSEYTSLQRSQTPAVVRGYAVRRLTPTECERLQGFPDGYTLIPYDRRSRAAKEMVADMVKYLLKQGYDAKDATNLAHCPDGPRYRAIGNSMAVPVLRWLGQRIQMAERTSHE